ncbi:PilZ domain-containing protein [Frateuria hangzhouensis]|uniref:PilZ domain-containing protein n=1 Tax=Frateuria hangzhouensis TaxID=2995589 RepID=UPI002260E3A0|nr:PilZ domain-containing protein [Frateuria sp. STR12]MCX7513137.1 PilZ domain-containing protein [Frateuria sp. STR12]
MSANTWNEFEQRLACEDSWPADSQALAWPFPEALTQRLAEHNAAALASVAALEERRADNADDDSPVMQELQRLDAKLNALIDMINRMALPADALPPRQSLRFNAIGAVLPAALAPAGEALLLRLRFDACPGMPLELPARIERRFDDGRIFVAFEALGDGVAASLERFVFRHHRRKVAGARQAGG